MTSRHAEPTRWTDDDRTRIVADRAPVPAQTYDPSPSAGPAQSYGTADRAAAQAGPPAREVRGVPVAEEQAPKPPVVRRTITVRVAAAVGVVAFLVGVGVSMLVGALSGPGDPGAGGPGGGFGGTPPGTSGQAVPGAPTDSATGTTTGT
jgi:hypothetical protein